MLTATLDAEISVYDNFRAEEYREGANCDLVNTDLAFINQGRNFLLKDPNTGETLAVGQLGAGTVGHELGEVVDLPDDVFRLFWYCSFTTTLVHVPLDRAFYTAAAEGEESVVTIDGGTLRSDRYVGVMYSFAEQEEIRNANR